MSCTDIIPRDELNLECITTGRTIVNYTVSNEGRVSDEDLQKLIDPLVNQIETMASVQAERAIDEYQGQLDDDEEENEKERLIAEKKTELSELVSYVKIRGCDEKIGNYVNQSDYQISTDFHVDLSIYSGHDSSETDPFFLQIELSDPERDFNELSEEDLDYLDNLDEDEYRDNIDILIDDKYAHLVNSKANNCFKTFYNETKSLSQTLINLRFMISKNLLYWTQKNIANSLINTIEMLQDIGLINVSNAKPASDRPMKRHRSRFDN